MSDPAPGFPSKRNETKGQNVWRQWFKEFGGKHWTDPEAMPEAARDPWNDYCHYLGNPAQDPTGEKKLEAADRFRKATGFDAEEVYQFKLSLDKKT